MGVLGFPVEQRQRLEVLGLRIKSGTVGTMVVVTAAQAARTCRLGADSRIAECTCYAGSGCGRARRSRGPVSWEAPVHIHAPVP